jgi:hypothetical protein
MKGGFAEKVEGKGFCPKSEGDSVSIPSRYLVGISTDAAPNCDLSPLSIYYAMLPLSDNSKATVTT